MGPLALPRGLLRHRGTVAPSLCTLNRLFVYFLQLSGAIYSKQSTGRGFWWKISPGGA